jgi:hypothetical protein
MADDGMAKDAELWIDGLDEPLRAALGLEADERLRVRERAGSWITLERVAPGPEAPPLGPPALQVDLAALPLSVVLEGIHAAGKSGLLHYAYRDQEKTVYLHKGEVVFARSNQRVDRLGECLLRAGVITLEQLRETERCFAPPQRFGKVLVERGFLSPRELWNGVKYQVEEIVRSLFAVAGGRVWFWAGEIQPDNVVRLSLETGRLVAEGLQRGQELRKFLTVLEDARVRLSCLPGFGDKLAGNERAIANAIGESNSFQAVCDALGQDREPVARSVQLLRLVGAVKLIRLAQAEGVLDERDLEVPDDQPLRARVASSTELIAALARTVSDAEEGWEIVGRLSRVLDDATGRFPALLTGITLGEQAAIDPQVLVDRALKLPGDRKAQLSDALGELVAYLEFEIKNHPQISDPDGELARLAEQRAFLLSGG